MLEFNPKERLTASQLLNHRAFNSIRVKSSEKGAPHMIQLDVDYYDGFETQDNIKLTTQKEFVNHYRKEVVQMAHKYRKYLTND